MNGLRRARGARIVSIMAAAAGLAATSGPAHAQKDPVQPGYAAILVDQHTREVLYANGADLPRHPASITKIMTLYLAFEALNDGRLHLTDRLVMSRHAVSQKPSHLGLGVGQSISVGDAISVIAVKSANDLAVALAERLGNTEENFAHMMTDKARQLGMRNTTFVNATGLPDPAHVTTARDIAILSDALIRTYPQDYTYFATEKFSYERQVFANHNHLLGRMPGMDGIKTGYTVDAGFTLAASAFRNGHRLIAVVLGEPTAAARDRDVTTLLDTGFTVEAGRGQGQQISVASLLAPLSHPAIRIALPDLEQGSTSDPTPRGDDRRPVKGAPAAPATLAEAPDIKAAAGDRRSSSPPPRHHAAEVADVHADRSHESPKTRRTSHGSELTERQPNRKPHHDSAAASAERDASAHRGQRGLTDAHASRDAGESDDKIRTKKKPVVAEADAHAAKKHHPDA